MPWTARREREARLGARLRASDPDDPAISLVSLVLLACEESEDAGEVDDLVADLIASGAARVLQAARDPLLQPGPAVPAQHARRIAAGVAA